MLTLGALNWSVEWYDAAGDQKPEDIADLLSTMIFEGLARHRAGATTPRSTSR
jgi:hypothetical protein